MKTTTARGVEPEPMCELAKDVLSGLAARGWVLGGAPKRNAWDGFDIADLDTHTVTRLALRERGEGGCEVISLSENGVHQWSATFDSGAPITAVIHTMLAA